MLQYFETLSDISGNSLNAATCQVQNYPSGTPAAIYNSNGTSSPVANSTVTSDITGQISFYAPDGDYTLIYSYAGTVYKTKSPVQILDPIGFVAGTDVGTVNAYAITSSAYAASLYVGLKAEFKAANTNTGSSTFNYNTTGAQPLNLPGGGSLGAGNIQATGLYRVEWDGAQWQLLGIVGTSTYAVTIAELAAGVTVVNLSKKPGNVDRYGNNTTPGTTPMHAAVSAAVAQCQQLMGSEVTAGDTGLYLLAAPVDCTFATFANQTGVVIRWTGGSSLDSGHGFLAKHSGNAVFDCTGCDGVYLDGLTVHTDPTTFPLVGVLTARCEIAGQVNSVFFKMSRCKFIGNFGYAPYYNYGSEDDVLDACHFWNMNPAANTATAIYTSTNAFGMTSPAIAAKGGAIATGSQSCIDHNDFACLHQNSAGLSTSDCVYMDAIDGYKKFGGWMYSASGASGGNGRSLFFVNLGNAASNFATLVGITGEYDSTGVATLNTLVGGSSYTNGTYTGKALTGGNGSGAIATIVVSGGAVTTVTLTSAGDRYLVGDTLSATASSIGGTGSGFSINVATVNGSRQATGIQFSNAAYQPQGWKVSGCKVPNMTGYLVSFSLTTLVNFSVDAISEQSGAGIVINGTLSDSPSFDYGFTTTVIGTSSNNRLTGDTSRLTVSTRSNDYWIDIGTVNKTWTAVTSGITVTGGVSVNSGRYSLHANLAYVNLVLTAGTNLSATLGQTIGGLPFNAIAYGGNLNIYDDSTAQYIGSALVITGTGNILLPAISSRAGIIISGTYPVA